MLSLKMTATKNKTNRQAQTVSRINLHINFEIWMT